MCMMVLPLLKVIVDSIDPTSYGVRLWPRKIDFSAYEMILTTSSLYRPFLVSVLTTVVGTVTGLFIITMGAYVLIQKDMPGHVLMGRMVLFTMMFSGGMIPTYLTIKNLGLMNNMLAVIIPCSVSAYNTILMRSFFASIPNELFESATIDGCSPFGCFWRIMLPLSKPALASVGLFIAVGLWNEYMHFILYITDPNWQNFQVKVRSLILEDGLSGTAITLSADMLNRQRSLWSCCHSCSSIPLYRNTSPRALPWVLSRAKNSYLRRSSPPGKIELYQTEEKNHEKNQISMLLATACAASLLAACGGSGSTTTDSSSAADTTATAASYYESAQKPDKLVWWVHDGMHQEDGSEQWIAEFDAKTGIDLELDFIDNNEYTKKLELAYASDTVPDTFDLNGETLGNYAAQGAIADLTDLVHESGLYDKVDKNLWDALTVNGKIYGVPRETPSAIVTYVRKDWLDRLGMDVPTTYDEFIEMLTRFKNEIPECTAPYTAPGLKSTQALPEFYQGATADYVKVDGKWVDGMAQDNMLTALQNLQDAYTAGLIDQEAITNTTSACRDEWYAGTVGCFPYWGGLWGETLTVRLKQNVPDAEVIALPPIEGATYLYSAPSVPGHFLQAQR